MNKIQLLAVSALLSLTACGGGDDPKALSDAGFKKLGTGDYTGAQDDLQAALTAMDDTSSAQYHEVKMGLLEATAYSDVEKAQTEFDAYAAASDAVTSDDYARFASALIDAGDAIAALSVADAGLRANPENAKLTGVMEQLKLKASSDSGLASGLESLGYL